MLHHSPPPPSKREHPEGRLHRPPSHPSTTHVACKRPQCSRRRPAWRRLTRPCMAISPSMPGPGAPLKRGAPRVAVAVLLLCPRVVVAVQSVREMIMRDLRCLGVPWLEPGQKQARRARLVSPAVVLQPSPLPCLQGNVPHPSLPLSRAHMGCTYKTSSMNVARPPFTPPHTPGSGSSPRRHWCSACGATLTSWRPRAPPGGRATQRKLYPSFESSLVLDESSTTREAVSLAPTTRCP